MEFENYDLLIDAMEELVPGARLEQVTITSDLAADILKHQVRNRDTKEVKSNIAKVNRALRLGYWNPVPVGRIAFYRKDQTLADGQCRLTAVAETDVPIVVDIETVDSVLGMDEGRPRTLAQELHMEGVGDPKIIAMITTALFKATDTGQGPGSIGEQVAFYRTEKDFITECAAKAHTWLLPVIEAGRILGEGPLAIQRALAIRQEPCWPAASVDAFLVDAVSGTGEFPMAKTLFEELGARPVTKPTKPLKKHTMTMVALDYHLKGKTAKRIAHLKNPKKKPGRATEEDTE